MNKAINKAINIFLVLVLLVDAFFVGYWYGLHSHKVLVVQGSDDFLYANSFTEFQSNFAVKKEAVKEKAEKRLGPIKEAVENRAKEKEAAQQAGTAPKNDAEAPKKDTAAPKPDANDTRTKDAAPNDAATTENSNEVKNSESGGTAKQSDGANSATEATSSKKAEE